MSPKPVCIASSMHALLAVRSTMCAQLRMKQLKPTGANMQFSRERRRNPSRRRSYWLGHGTHTRSSIKGLVHNVQCLGLSERQGTKRRVRVGALGIECVWLVLRSPGHVRVKVGCSTLNTHATDSGWHHRSSIQVQERTPRTVSVEARCPRRHPLMRREPPRLT